MENRSDILVIGAGPAGLTAALYASRAKKSVTVIEAVAPGGQSLYAERLQNYPGLPDTAGFTLCTTLLKQAKEAGASVVSSRVTGYQLTEKMKSVTTQKGTFYAPCVILCMGRQANLPDVENAVALLGRGLSTCAVCDGMFYRNKRVVVLGGGDTAFSDARTLSAIASEVTVVHRRDTFRATPVLVEEVQSLPNVRFITSATLQSILTDEKGVTGVVLSQGDQTRTEPCDGVFAAIGATPSTQGLPAEILNESGYIVTDERMQTAIPGVFAAGDVRTTPLRQVVTACADGAIAATYAAEQV